jgi:hypothetical protein
VAIVALRRLAFAACVLWLVALPMTGVAHRLPPEVVAFFRVEGPRLRVLVRVPTAMLADARLPLTERVYLDLRTIDERLRVIATEVTRSLDLADSGRSLSAGATAWILSPLGDSSFTSYDTATARFTQAPIPVDRFVYWNEAYVDIQLDYPLSDASPAISARLNGLRMGGDFFQTRATYLPATGRPRTWTVTGPPQRIFFEPPLSAAVTGFIRRGVDQLTAQPMLLLFVFCLAIPQWRMTQALGPFAAFVAALALVAVLAVSLGDAPAASAQSIAEIAAGAGLVLAAVQNVAASGPGAAVVAAVAFGAGSGVGLGADLREMLPLAGSHAAAAIVAFLIVLSVGALWVLLIMQPLVRMAFRWRAPAWLVTAALSAVPAHQAAHAVVDAAGRLAAQDLALAGPATQAVVAHWPVLALASAVLVLAAVSRLRRAEWTGPDGRIRS